MLTTLTKYLLAKLATEAFLKTVCLITAKHLAAKTTTKIDDELVQALEKALN